MVEGPTDEAQAMNWVYLLVKALAADPMSDRAKVLVLKFSIKRVLKSCIQNFFFLSFGIRACASLSLVVSRNLATSSTQLYQSR
jgi:hypothetical protein